MKTYLTFALALFLHSSFARTHIITAIAGGDSGPAISAHLDQPPGFYYLSTTTPHTTTTQKIIITKCC